MSNNPVALSIVRHVDGHNETVEVFDVISELKGYNWIHLIWLRKPTDEEFEWIKPIQMTKRYLSVHHAYGVN